MAARSNNPGISRETRDLILIGAGVVGIMYIAKKFGGLIPDFGVEDTGQEQRVIEEANKVSSPFNPQFYKNAPRGTYLLTDASANNIALIIENSVNPVWDDFSQVLGVFKQLKTQAQVSQVADRFMRNTAHDLITWLVGGVWPNDRFSAEEVNQVVNYVNKLPKYIP